MKNLVIYALLLIVPFILQGQSQRLVLIEEATNASCGPCASQNPGFDALLDQNRDKIAAIKYHWYFPGYDPMHNHNVTENNARVAYYGINGVPTATIDGDIPNGPTFGYPGSPAGYRQALIDQYYAVPSPFEMSMSHSLSQDEDSIFVNMMILCTEAVSGNLVAQMVVVEKEIHFSSPPGSNGEKDFYDVMKKMIPDHYGTALPGAFEPGDYMILQGSWALQNIYDMDMLGAVGFIQDNAGKEVQQAANSSEDPLTPLYNTEVTVTAVENISETNCLGVVTPVVTIRNNGGNEVTSVNIHYHVNGEELHTVPWSGSLSFLESTIIGLPEISFSIEDMNDLVIYTSDPNGITDEYVKNDTLHHEFAKAVVAPTIINFLIRTDTHPEEITWEILNAGGGVVHSGGPYTQANTMISQELEINDEDCYQFRIYDSGGDGLVLPGFYALYYGGSNYIATGTDFGSIDTAYFSVSTGTGFAELNSSLDIHVYPNPAKDMVNLDFFLEKPASVSVEVIDLTGNVVIIEEFGWQEQGPARLQLRTSSLATGTYFLRIRAGEYTFHERFVKAQ